MNLSRQDQIKLARKFYVKIRAMHEDLIYLQSMSDHLHLDTSKINIPLYAINSEIQKYHDAARNLERDLDEAQQYDFTRRENSALLETFRK